MSDQHKIAIIVEAYNKSKAAFQTLLDDFKRLIKESGSFKLQMTQLDNFLKQGIGLGALYKLTTGIGEALNAAEKMQNSLRGLAAIARYSGEDIGASMQAATQLAADGLITVQDAAQALQNLLSRGFTLQEATTMVERLKDAAAFNRQASLSMSDAVRSATEGLKNENSILVDNAGVTKNVSIMWKEYAASIGKTEDTLTQAEKRQAEFNGIMRETEGQLGNAKLAMEGLTGTKAQLSVEIERLNVALGTSLLPAFVTLAKAGNWVLDNFVKPFLGGIEIMALQLSAFVMKVEATWDWLTSGFKGGTNTLIHELARLDLELEKQAIEVTRKYEGGIQAPTLGRDSGKRRQDIVTPTKKDPKKEASAWRAAQEAAINYDLFLVDMAEQEHAISKSEATEKRIELIEQLLAIQEKYAAKIDRLKDPTGWYTQQNEIIKTRSKLLELNQALREQSGEILPGIEEGFQRYLYAVKTAFQQGIEMAQEAARAMESAFSDFFFDAMTGKLKKLGEYVTGFLQAIARAIANMLAQQAAQQILGSFFMTSPAALTAGPGTLNTGSGFVNVPTAHAGGLVMHSGGYVPRFHAGGLSSDERPAILQSGEYVVSRKGVAALDAINSGNAGGVNVQVNVENKSSQPVNARQSGQQWNAQMKSYIVGVILEDMEGNGPVRQVITGLGGR